MTIQEFVKTFNPRVIKDSVISVPKDLAESSDLDVKAFVGENRTGIIEEINRVEAENLRRIKVRSHESSTPISIEMFGKTMAFKSIGAAESAIECLEKIKESIAKKTCIEVSWTRMGRGQYLFVICEDSARKIWENLDEEIAEYVRENSLESIFNIDEEASKAINEGYTGDYYRSGAYKKEFIEAINSKCDEYASLLREFCEKTLPESEEAVRAEEEYKTLWEQTAVHKHTDPRGGETGIDGYHDATYRRKTDGAEVRVISRDVFDVGRWNSLPREVGMHGAAPDRTEAEESCINWLCKYPVFGFGCRM